MERHEKHEVELLDELRAEAAAASRERQRVLEHLQRESATFLGLLADLAEQRRPVVVRLATGATASGPVDVVGADVVAVGGTWARLAAIVAVRATGGAAARDECVLAGIDLAGVLARLVADKPRVVLHVAGGEAVRGELVAVGEDVVTLRLDGPGGEVAYVPMGAVSAVRATS